jgi:amidase
MSLEKLLWSHDATGLAELVRKGEVQPRELVDAAIARAEKVEPEINAIAEPLFERARDMALEVDRKAPFAGVPFALKDLGTVWNGVPVHNGSRLPPAVPDRDSVLVHELRV